MKTWSILVLCSNMIEVCVCVCVCVKILSFHFYNSKHFGLFLSKHFHVSNFFFLHDEFHFFFSYKNGHVQKNRDAATKNKICF